MRICIIGAGAAGLSSARHATEEKYGHKCIVFEQANDIGGTWIYSDKVGLDEDGYPVHFNMYKKLRTNLPKELMGFPDFQCSNYKESYVTQEQMLAFLNRYADHFNLRSVIQLNHRVKHVKPYGNTWKVTVTNLKTKEDNDYEFDAIMICNGHHCLPSYPTIIGSDIFTGKQMHSHDYRDENDFTNQTVLLIGAGPSGLDISMQLAHTAKKVYLSHHTKELKTLLPNYIEQKPDVSSMTEEEIIFQDGSKIKVDVVMYCTGYLYSFPFLDEKCGIKIDENHVNPLYKHVLNVNYPTMSFIGLPFYVYALPMFDLQARYALEFLQGTFTLPPKDVMFKEINDNISELLAKGISKKNAHLLGDKQENYYNSLASEAKIEFLPPVLLKLYNVCWNKCFIDITNFRNDVYSIVDENNFVKLN